MLRGAHPRASGENRLLEAEVDGDMGSSPRWRGKLEGLLRFLARSGLIPALAGKTSAPLRPLRSARAHPRAGGENCLRERGGVCGQGSSPRWRGKPRLDEAGLNRGGLIPALAGKTARAASRPPVSRAHPRAGGENGGVLGELQGECGSSPRWRGKQRSASRASHGPGLIPALAGKTPAAP